jgi:hypothetical protein
LKIFLDSLGVSGYKAGNGGGWRGFRANREKNDKRLNRLILDHEAARNEEVSAHYR